MAAGDAVGMRTVGMPGLMSASCGDGNRPNASHAPRPPGMLGFGGGIARVGRPLPDLRGEEGFAPPKRVPSPAPPHTPPYLHRFGCESAVEGASFGLVVVFGGVITWHIAYSSYIIPHDRLYDYTYLHYITLCYMLYEIILYHTTLFHI